MKIKLIFFALFVLIFSGVFTLELTASALEPDKLTDSSYYKSSPCISSDGKNLAYSIYKDGKEKIWIMDLEGKSQAKEIPVDAVINASREDVVERVRSITRERFADLAIEASGSPEAIAQTVQVIRKLGKISAIGLPGNKPVQFPWQDAMSKVVDLHFNLSSSHSSWIRAVAVMGAERMDPGFIVTHEFPLERWEEAFDIAETGSGAKVLLIPQ